TTVICYVGSVSVTAVGTAKVVKTSNQAQSNQSQVTLSAGQMVVIGLKGPPEGFAPESGVIEALLRDTDVNPHVNPHVVLARPKVWIPIVTALAGGLTAGLVLTYGGGSSVPPPVV